MGKFNLAEAIAARPAAAVQERTIDAITADILESKRVGGEAILNIGKCLIEAKGMLSHGEWLPWLTEQVEFSERTATRFMRLAREWTNQTALSDLGATKALALLALPPEERERFMAESHEVDGEEKNVVDMSARQLEQALRDREEALAEKQAAEEARAQMERDMKVANQRLEAARQESDAASKRMEQLSRELEELKARPIEVVGAAVPDQSALNAAKREGAAEGRKNAEAEMRAKLDKAKEAARKAEECRKAAEDALEAAKRQLEEQAREEKKASLSTDKDVAQFEVFFNQGQELANKMRGLLLKVRGREDSSAAQGMTKAIRALAEAIGRCAE